MATDRLTLGVLLFEVGDGILIPTPCWSILSMSWFDVIMYLVCVRLHQTNSPIWQHLDYQQAPNLRAGVPNKMLDCEQTHIEPPLYKQMRYPTR
ncbi:hypothetical protein F4824DRAFT_141680 [Ustulina deusta]|nr:hypothetical protein F4824DRAFT_141680 [Ustulina deusta]